ncbi:MAG: hypothetical protein ABI402_03335 [Ferruginibacter sp.]
MSVPTKYKAPFVENELYHVYNRTNNKELLFINDADRYLFLWRFNFYTAPFLEPFTWNLQLNHFHFYVRIKSFEEINDYLNTRHSEQLCITERKFLSQEATIHDLIDNVFKRFFISYSIRFNKFHNRKGNLFHRPFKHVLTDKESQFSQTVIYINANAVKHKLVKEISEYKWSSYHELISENPTTLLRKELLEWFGGRAAFIKIHNDQSNYYYSCDAAIDDD